METVKWKSNGNAKDKKKFIYQRIHLFTRHKTVEERNCTVEAKSREIILIKPQGGKKKQQNQPQKASNTISNSLT